MKSITNKIPKKPSTKKRLLVYPMETTMIKDSASIKKESDEETKMQSKFIAENKYSAEDKSSKQIPKKQRKINVRSMITGAYSRKR